MLSENLTPEIAENYVMYNSGVVEALLVGVVTGICYSGIYCRPVTSRNTFP
jgi:hypothetical protein